MDMIVAPCMRCSQPVDIGVVQSTPNTLRCGHCEAEQIQFIYPAGYRDENSSAPIPATEVGATCYFHDVSNAQHLCDDCGRYLCDLCTLYIPMPANLPAEFPERLCPPCFENRVELEMKHQRWDLFRTHYPRYDVVAGFLVFGPVVLFPFVLLSILTLPVGLFVLFRYWRSNRTPVQRFRGSMVATVFAAIIGIAIWTVAIASSIMEMR